MDLQADALTEVWFRQLYCQDPNKVLKEEQQKAIARLREIYTWQLQDVTEFLEVLKELLHVNLREVLERLHYSKRMELQLQMVV